MQNKVVRCHDAYGLGRGIKTEFATHTSSGTLGLRVVVEESDEPHCDASLLRAQAMASGMRARIGMPVRAHVRTATDDSPAALIMELAIGVDGMDFPTLRFMLRRIERVAASMALRSDHARDVQAEQLHV